MREQVRARAEKAIQERVFPGCVVGIVRGENVEYVCEGRHTYELDAEPVHPDTLYDVASITKSIPTASLALVLAHENKLSLDERVRAYVPELQHDYNATVRDLLRYTVSGTRLSELKTLSAEQIYKTVLERGFVGPPGARAYSNLPAYIVGLVIERVTGRNLDTLAQEYFFGPLGMQGTSFYTGTTFLNAVPTENDDWRGMVRGVAHDESAYILGKSGRASGHAGLFSTASDIVACMRALMHPKDSLWMAVVEGAEAGLGWQTSEPSFMGSYVSAHTFGKTGFTGTSLVVNRQRNIGLVILSNRTFPKRPSDTEAISVLRRDVADIVFGPESS